MGYGPDYSLVCGFARRYCVGEYTQDGNTTTANMLAGKLIIRRRIRKPSGRWACSPSLLLHNGDCKLGLGDLLSVQIRTSSCGDRFDLVPGWALDIGFMWSFHDRCPIFHLRIYKWEQWWCPQWWLTVCWAKDKERTEIIWAAARVLRGEFPPLAFMDWLQDKGWPPNKKKEWEMLMQEIFP